MITHRFGGSFCLDMEDKGPVPQVLDALKLQMNSGKHLAFVFTEDF